VLHSNNTKAKRVTPHRWSRKRRRAEIGLSIMEFVLAVIGAIAVLDYVLGVIADCWIAGRKAARAARSEN
jgi:hypothetical protein